MSGPSPVQPSQALSQAEKFQIFNFIQKYIQIIKMYVLKIDNINTQTIIAPFFINTELIAGTNFVAF